MPNFDPTREELEHVSGDRPTDGPVGKLGLFDLTRNAYRVLVRYRDQVIECEVFALPGEPITVHWLCPRCGPSHTGVMSTINGAHKKIDFDPRRKVEDGGCLSVEPFKCSWELDGRTDGSARRQEFSLGMCSLTLAIDDNIAKEA